MLEYQKSKLSELYANHTLKLEPFLLRISGYNAQETRLKIDTHLLHCTPGTFSLKECKFLLFLNPSEVEYFKAFEQKTIALNLAFDETYFDKPVAFFLKGKFESLKTMRENVYIIDFTLINMSDAYKEIFLYLCQISAIYKKIFDNKLSDDQIEGIRKAPIFSTEILKSNKLICYGKLADLSVSGFKIIVFQPNTEIEVNTKYQFVIRFNNRPIKLSGEIVEIDAKKYTVKLDFNIEFVHILSKYMNIVKKGNRVESESVEEVEEL
ncbi:MAG: hypothetical protein OCD02_05415 [Spirochaetaceae bacterium]